MWLRSAQRRVILAVVVMALPEEQARSRSGELIWWLRKSLRRSGKRGHGRRSSLRASALTRPSLETDPRHAEAEEHKEGLHRVPDIKLHSVCLFQITLQLNLAVVNRKFRFD